MGKFLLSIIIFFSCSVVLMAQKRPHSKTGTQKRLAFKKDRTRVNRTIVLKNGNTSPAVSPKDKKN